MIQLDTHDWTQLLQSLQAMGLTVISLDASTGEVCLRVPNTR